MKEDPKEAGRRGEELACRLLEEEGYRIIKRNFRYSHGEIDIVAKIEDLLVFVEVKTRTNDLFGPPEAAITRAKQKQIIKIAKAYLYMNDIHDLQCRFDVIAVNMEDYLNPKLNHIVNAFIDM